MPTQQKDGYMSMGVGAKVINRHQCYVASRTHDPNRDELPISKDKLVSAGLAVMEACDICDHQADFEQCAIFHLMREYFDIDRGGAVCPYDANGEQKEAEIANDTHIE